MNVRDRALFCYRLLECGVEETQRMFQGPKSDPCLGVLTGRPQEPISSWASKFNTLGALCGGDINAVSCDTQITDEQGQSLEGDALTGECDDPQTCGERERDALLLSFDGNCIENATLRY